MVARPRSSVQKDWLAGSRFSAKKIKEKQEKQSTGSSPLEALWHGIHCTFIQIAAFVTEWFK
jgi:hypothetical protein